MKTFTDELINHLKKQFPVPQIHSKRKRDVLLMIYEPLLKDFPQLKIQYDNTTDLYEFFISGYKFSCKITSALVNDMRSYPDIHTDIQPILDYLIEGFKKQLSLEHKHILTNNSSSLP